jgi:hypothetical protein
VPATPVLAQHASSIPAAIQDPASYHIYASSLGGSLLSAQLLSWLLCVPAVTVCTLVKWVAQHTMGVRTQPVVLAVTAAVAGGLIAS